MGERPLRIAHFALTALPLSVGGLEVVVDGLIRAQRRAGHDVALVTRWRQARSAVEAGVPYPVHALLPNPRRAGAPFRDVGWRWPTSVGIRALQVRHRFDVWHAHWVYPTAWLAVRALESMEVPLVATAHGADVEIDLAVGHGFRQFDLHERRIRELTPRLHHLTAVSPAIRKTLLDLGAADSRIATVENGVDVERFSRREPVRSDVCERHGLPTDRPLVLTVGSSRPAKGHRNIRPVFEALRNSNHRVAWAVVGGDPSKVYGAEPDRLARSGLRVIPPVRPVAGDPAPSDELIDLYRAADVVVMPSLSEGFGLAALEAMAAGTPLVASDLPSLRSITDDGKCALLVPPGHPDAIADAVSRVLTDPTLAAQLGARGRRLAAVYDGEHVTKRYVDVYRRAIEGAGS